MAILCKHQWDVYHILGDHLARAVKLSAHNRSGNGTGAALHVTELSSSSFYFVVADLFLSLCPWPLKAAIHFADRPPCSASLDFHLEKQAHSS